MINLSITVKQLPFQQQIVKVTHKNADLLQERDNLKRKLETLSEDESKR